jgi:hypothetical protein
MSDFPRCPRCRVTIEPGQRVTFRSEDGRFRHVECPDVRCPLCTRPIDPGDPIRRDQEELLHANCWHRRRRARTASRLGAEPDVAPIIRGKLAAATLPLGGPTKVWCGFADDSACAGCGGTIARSGPALAVEFAKAVIVRFHRRCFEIWDDERSKLPPTISGGSEVRPPCTVVCDLGISAAVRLAALAHAEVLLASRQTRLIAAALRRRSAAVRARTGRLQALLLAQQHRALLAS